jgi:inhibitor of KinA sporulation pathway (predicted exonuclease)
MQKLNTLHSAIYLDLEWNCPDTSCHNGAVEEIIEIGLVELDPTSLNINREASYLVRPRQLDISFRCTAITGITRCDLIGARPLREVIAKIAGEWPSKSTCFAWGEDEEVFVRACRAHQVPAPFRRFVDLSRTFQRMFLLSQQTSVRRATEALGLLFDGCEHMALADARNAARIHAEILRRLRSTEPPATPRPKIVSPCKLTWFGQLLQQSLLAIPSFAGSTIERPNQLLSIEPGGTVDDSK